MEIIAHRGWWIDPQEKNTMAAFTRAFEAKIGIELDVRDLDGEVVISHDMPRHGNPIVTFVDLVKIWRNYERPTLAINIKSDGLSEKLKDLFKSDDEGNYFFFDMSLPESLQYKKKGLITAERLSEYEREPKQTSYIWLDSFNTDWWLNEDLSKFLSAKIYAVSPELHQRPYMGLWQHVKKNGKFSGICTDYVEEAIDFFHE